MTCDVRISGCLQDFVAAWNTRDISRLMDCFDPEATFKGPVGPDPSGSVAHGHEAIRTALQSMFEQLPSGKLVPTLLFCSATHALSEWYYEYPGPLGTPVRTYGCDVYEFAGDLIMSKNAYIKHQTGEP